MVDAIRPLVVAVDDDPAVLSALTRLLCKEPYDFVPIADPDQALEIVRTREVSLLIADYRMPSLSGTGLLQVVKATSPSTKRIMLTGYPQSTWVERAWEKKLMEAVLEKPWDNDELRRAIRSRVVGSQEPATP
jgi:response regulator RpfG family c-di-GMP phosphodiesterase